MNLFSISIFYCTRGSFGIFNTTIINITGLTLRFSILSLSLLPQLSSVNFFFYYPFFLLRLSHTLFLMLALAFPHTGVFQLLPQPQYHLVNIIILFILYRKEATIYP
ncbi:hypothetical protein BDC45DRAFT_276862 [Circinella umbellata]|nr:hypothetical protein BDC45DRAFT_276862 [Circinella umbellata]